MTDVDRIIRINDQETKYDTKLMVMQSGAYPDAAVAWTDLVENKQGVHINASLVKPVIVTVEGKHILLMANKSLEAIKAERLKLGKEKIVCKLANKYILKKALHVVPPAYTDRAERTDHRSYAPAPRRHYNNAPPSRGYRSDYDHYS